MRSGFSIIRNGEKLGYPYLEAIRSLAPLVDELVVAVGDSDDGTRASLESLRETLPCPLVLFDSPWDRESRKGGFELARQTNLALEKCRYEICIYIQADEVIHEGDLPDIRRDLETFEKDEHVDALAFSWVHFYGNFDTIINSRKWYRREIRAVKRSRLLKSYGDAQSFRIFDGGTWSKPRAALSRGRFLHYGWVRPPDIMALKSEALDRLWHGAARDGKHTASTVYPRIFGMTPYPGTHPAIMKDRVARTQSQGVFETKGLNKDLRFWRLYFDQKIERYTGWRPGEWTNYRSLKIYK